MHSLRKLIADFQHSSGFFLYILVSVDQNYVALDYALISLAKPYFLLASEGCKMSDDCGDFLGFSFLVTL